MALPDLLNAIVAQADQQIARQRAEHQKDLTRMREETEQAIARKKQEIAVQKEQKKAQLKSKAETHSTITKRNLLLTKKQELLDRLYAEVVKELGAMPEAKAEKFLRACLSHIAEKGHIIPSKKHEALLKKIAPSERFTLEKPIDAEGGFIFRSKHLEQDFTFERLVADMLRPETELDAAKKLFS